MGTVPPGPTGEQLLEQYRIHVGMYKHHMELALKFNLLYYAITGAILSFYFVHRTDSQQVKLVLLFPAILSFVFFLLFGYASTLVEAVHMDVRAICAALHFQVVPHILVLKHVLRCFAVLYLVVGVGILLVLFKLG